MYRYTITFLLFTIFTLTVYAHETAQTLSLNPHTLPLGDGKISTEPMRGYVYACMSSFRGGGAQHNGSWIHGLTWDETEKLHVQGDVLWPQALISITVSGNQRLITSNALPNDHTTGIFPIQSSDPAYQIDRNPNSISEQSITLALPLTPVLESSPSCVPMGMIGVTIDGVPLFNALDDAGRDAVAHEVQDNCNGHPQRNGEYHYHGPTSCIKNMSANNALIGYALDGFGIYSIYDENGKELTNNDLDECHGRVSNIIWDGKAVEMYHYVMTREYPYTIGCFKGNIANSQHISPTTDRQARQPPFQNGNNQQPQRRQPPAEAVNSCYGSSQGAACSFETPRGDTIRGTCQSPTTELACVPDRE